MPRRRDRKQINCTVSAAQHQAALDQAQTRKMGLCEYVRYVLEQDAERLGKQWPRDLKATKVDE